LRTEVLGVATLTERGTAAAFEIQRCGVEEGDRDLAEQRAPMRIKRLTSMASVRRRGWLSVISSPSQAIAL
jgi:hypothetical protein